MLFIYFYDTLKKNYIIVQISLQDKVGILKDFLWNKWERSYQCEQDTRLHFSQHISNLWRKAFIRADNLSGISLALQKYQWKSPATADRCTNEWQKWPLRRDFLMKSRSSGSGRQTDRQRKCQPKRERITNNLHEQNEQRIVGRNTWAVLCAPRSG